MNNNGFWVLKSTGEAVEEEAGGAAVGGADEVAVAKERAEAVVERDGGHVESRRGAGGGEAQSQRDRQDQTIITQR